ncbi:PEP-CTERM sorting domain-containing protein [Phenylobacterium sp.]|uniref:PEP-CTERM sorting domain-containing protein n=1 Tax=Phenylobacterium sp. TaxID=1871053 RepID=UPI0035210485
MTCGVPEPATWSMIIGFGAAGSMARPRVGGTPRSRPKWPPHPSTNRPLIRAGWFRFRRPVTSRRLHRSIALSGNQVDR